MNTKQLFRIAAACLVSTTAFSLTMFSFHADISLAALPLSLAFTAALFFTVRALFVRDAVRVLPVFRELLQYEPYLLLIAFVLRRAGNAGTPLAIDALSVLLWLVSSALVLVLLHFVNPKRAGALDARWGAALIAKKRRGLSLLCFELVSWIDALVQAVFMVLLLNVFIVQLYEIPSESMVPEFLIKDRVIVFKTVSGPKFPLSTIGLPCLRPYRRGDIVVFRNPHYANDRKSEVRAFISQIVYMVSLTTVNLNVDADGNPKADPLVKRVVGVAGEQLMMQDGVLYARTAEHADWRVVADDARWAAWNLHAVRPDVKGGIQQFPLSERDYNTMLSLEAERNALDMQAVAAECGALAERFSVLSAGFAGERVAGGEPLSAQERSVHALFSRASQLARRLLQTDGGEAWFRAFMTDWTATTDVGCDRYEQANFRLNVLIKRTFGRLIVRNAELLLLSARISASDWSGDRELREYLEQANALYLYTLLLDRRNMPAFPANAADGSPQYIPEHCYFMMGDNRFNSLDMRHSYEEWLAPLTPYDRYSATYYTNMQPQYVDRSRILGTTSFRFWPTSRMGVPGHTGL